MAFSPDGRFLASAGEDGLIKLWDPASGQELRDIAAHRNCERLVVLTRWTSFGDGELRSHRETLGYGHLAQIILFHGCSAGDHIPLLSRPTDACWRQGTTAVESSLSGR